VYEKIRFPRVRQAQTNGEDLRDRWHSALDKIGEGEEHDPASLLIRVRCPDVYAEHLWKALADRDRMLCCTIMTLKQTRENDGPR
jgi:hypothetical protein